MSVGLLRILFQNKLIEQDQVEKYREKVNQNKNIIPMLAEAGIIKQADLALLLAKLFHYPILDLSLYSRSMMVQDVLNDSQMTEYRCVPLFKRGQKLFLGVSDPTLLQTYQKLVFPSGLIVDLILVNDEQLDRLLEFASQTSTAILDEISADSTTLATPAALKVDDEEEDGPIAKFIYKVLSDALNTGASDIHFEFYEEMARIRFRTDGQLREVVQPPLNIRGQIASRIKVMSKMDISEKRVPQDGRIQLQFNKNQKPIDFRVNTLPTLFGEKIVMRILNSDAATLNINQLGFEPFQKELLLEAIHRPYGMVLVTGPTGSGKTVSLYTCLNILNTDSVNISTAEDPAEINLPGINQVNVNDKQGMTFAA
ncbi:MAG: GspE/PulE family protein, partial [Eikenella corrodens]